MAIEAGDRATNGQIREWLMDILRAMPVAIGVDESRRVIALVMPSLKSKFPALAFTDASRASVLGSVKFFAAADITTALEAWWQANAPVHSRFPPEIRNIDGMDFAGKDWLMWWQEKPCSHRISIIATYHPGAFAHLLRTDPYARELADKRKIAMPDTIVDRRMVELQAHWGDPAVVARAVDSAFGFHENGERSDIASPGMPLPAALSLLRSIVKRHAPDNLRLIPDDPSPYAEPVPPGERVEDAPWRG